MPITCKTTVPFTVQYLFAILVKKTDLNCEVFGNFNPISSLKYELNTAVEMNNENWLLV